MENVGFKGLLKTLWQRVVLSYKSTLIGIGVAVALVVAENLLHSPNKILSTIGLVVGSVLALYKERLPTPEAL